MVPTSVRVGSAISITLVLGVFAAADDTWPELPEQNAPVEIPAQQWPANPGPRTVRTLVHFPDGKLSSVNARTGVMLSLHNWGGTDCAGTANPQVLADRLNVVAICVNYLQSGRRASIEDPEPYDCGYLQALDALRALWFVCDGLEQREIEFDATRIYCTGGSGGGNVTLMANKLAPRTFACVIDMCGMKKLSHDIAFNLPGGSGLNARWSRQLESPNYLSVDDQEIRFVGHPAHLAKMKQLGTTSKVIVVHGTKDTTCPFADAREMVDNMQQASCDVEPIFLTDADLDGSVFTSTGHALGNRTEIVFRVAEKYLTPGGPEAIRRQGRTDFQRADHKVRYETTNGEFMISYENGFPVGQFVPTAEPVTYPNHQDLSYVLGRDGRHQPIRTAADWQRRREHILQNLQLVMGTLPSVMFRVPLQVDDIEQRKIGSVVARKISFQSDPYDRVKAWLLRPEDETQLNGAAVLCLHQTVAAGKDETVGLAGSSNMHYAMELAQRGFVTLSPDYPSLGEHPYDFAKNPEYASGSMKAVWDNIRGVDVLVQQPGVDAAKIGVIGHSLGGHNAMFTAVFEPRLRVVVSSCGFSRFHKDDVPSWSGARYMPRIASSYQNKADLLPFDFAELVATFAPRPFLVCAATDDSDFEVSGVRDVVDAAAPIYQLLGAPAALQATYTEGPRAWPAAMRQQSYDVLELDLLGAD